MIYRRRRNRTGVPGGFYRFLDANNRQVIGPGDGDYIHLRDEFGNEWKGVAERQSDDTIRFRFRDSNGNHISGISDGYGVTLRDQKGKTWRGFVD
jgi:hypothetical protein